MATDDRRSRLPLAALCAANAISWTGNGITWVAVPWFVLETTGSVARTGVAGFVTGLATVLAGILGGPVVDRVGAKRVSIAGDILSGATVALIPLLHHTVGIEFWQLLALVFLGALLDMPGATAREALLPDAAERGGTPLVRANALLEGIGSGAELAGPLLAGVLIALLGTSNALYVDAATFAVSALLVAVALPGVRAETVEEESTPYWRDLATGWRFIRGTPLLRTLTGANLLTNFVGAPLFTVVMLAWVADTTGNASDLGLIVAAGAAGLLAGAAAFVALGERLPRRPTLLTSYAAFGAQMWVVALQPPLWVVIAVFALRGFVTAPYNPILQTIFQERTPAELRGRVFGTEAALAQALLPLGFLAGGALVARAGVVTTLLVMGAGYALALLWVALGTRGMR